MNRKLLLILCQMGYFADTLQEGEKKGYYVCDSDVCKERAKQIMDSIDTSVGPCDDFYAYACGGWREKNSDKLNGRSSFGIIQMLSENLRQSLKRIMGNIPLVTENQTIVEKIAIAFKSCVALSGAEEPYEDFLQILKASGLEGWPIAPEISDPTSIKTSSKEMLLQTGMQSVLGFYVGRGAIDPASYYIQLDQVDFNLLQRDVLLHPGSEENKPVIDTYKTLMEKAMEFVRPNISKEEVASISETLLEFEGQLANLTTPPEDRQDVSNIYHHITIGELQKKYPDFPLLKLLNREFSMADITLNETEYLDFYAMSYYSKLTEFLHQVKPDVLFNYAGFRMVISLGEYASKEIRNALSEVRGDPTENYDWKKCIQLFREQTTDIMDYLYVQEMFSLEGKIEVEYIVEKLTESFSKIVQSSDWMDDHTKKIALEKLIKMKSKIGYPLRLTSTDYIDELYNRVPPVTLQNSFLYIWDKILESNYINNLKQLHENHDEDADWPVGPANVNAFYNPHGNEVVFPSGILQDLFFKHELPWSLNFGSIGAVIGHEITHGLDLTGSQYDAEGQLDPWWSDQTHKNYEAKAACFISQYGKIINPDVNLTAYQEIIKKRCEKNDTRLNGLEHISGKELFFLSNAMAWCEVITEDGLRWDIENSRYSPNQYRQVKLSLFRDHSSGACNIC
ncbi:neprilysin-1 isoform X2 [Dermacentor silvarum]|uniref:neprilysin-1 isoform X2 n=1 Tax=Dermacentor silvarum TaxID=543639 RepID=UPI002101C5BA|nr:neprilysin-1 isoform X2 [Dermacentor silvarum]